MSIKLCRHVRTNGRRCRAASLNESPWCFFHKNQNIRHQGFRHTESTRGYLIPGQHLELAPIEDRDSVQLALSLVINALAVGQLEIKRATALLYGLQLASMNVNRLIPPHATDVVRETETSEEGLALAEPAIHEPLPFDPDQEEEDEENEEFGEDEENGEDEEDEESYG